MRRRTFTGALALGAAASVRPAAAQTWPAKPLHMVIPYPPGGPSDVSTRIVMERVGQILGQGVLFDNKAGASGMIGAEYVKNQPVDTYTFLTTTTASAAHRHHAPNVRRVVLDGAVAREGARPCGGRQRSRQQHGGR